MKRDIGAEDDLNAVFQHASGPVLAVFQEAGTAIVRKMGERRLILDDLKVREWLHSALLEAMIKLSPEADAEIIATELETAFAKIAMDSAANADGGRGRN